MKLKTWTQALWLIAVFNLTVACSSSHGPGAANGSQTVKNQDDGSSSGGGSFGDESSLKILRWAADDLSQQISNSSPEIYKNLPAGWTQEKLAQVIRDVEPVAKTGELNKVPEISRYGQRLMFNYGKTTEGKAYITATKLFMDAYSHFEVNTRPKQDFYATLEEVKLKLVHEASHLMGLGLTKETDSTEARKFARSVIVALDSDNMECLPASPLPVESYPPMEAQMAGSGLDRTLKSEDTPEEVERQKQEWLREKTRAYVFNRPSGRAAVPSNVQSSCGVNADPGTACSTPRHRFSSGYITVFAPRSYDHSFKLETIRNSVLEGKREYGAEEGFFSWNLVDLRKAVLTPEGYKSDYKYEKESRMNDSFADYQDFIIQRSNASELELRSYPPVQQENWTYYRSRGESKILVAFDKGNITSAKLVIVRDFGKWLEQEAPEINIEVPLTCVRSFKPID